MVITLIVGPVGNCNSPIDDRAVATFAALLSEKVVQVTFKNALTSYADVAESKDYAWPLSAFLPGVLEEFNLPDCYRALQKKGLKQIEPWDAAASKK